MRAARDLFVQRCPDVESDGEMHGDAALSERVRRTYLPDSTLSGAANLLVLPNIDAANILFNVLKMTGGHGVTVGPVLLGAARPAHILTPSATVRRVVNMTALAVADAVDSELARTRKLLVALDFDGTLAPEVDSLGVAAATAVLLHGLKASPGRGADCLS